MYLVVGGAVNPDEIVKITTKVLSKFDKDNHSKISVKKYKEPIKVVKGMKIVMPKWLEFNTETLKGKILALPKREDIDADLQERLVIELYSR